MNFKQIHRCFRSGFQIIPCFILILGSIASLQAQHNWSQRWVYVADNLYVDSNVDRLEELLTQARKDGYNGVVFTDYKTFTWWQLENAARWHANAQRLRNITRRLKMDLIVCVFPFGYADSLLWHNVNLASGVPIRQAPLKRIGNRLEPIPTATLRNGSFEASRDNLALDYAFQDDPGKSSFIDREVVKEGKASLRFENIGSANPHGNGRICQKVKVQPWQQYLIRAWMKTKDLTGGEIKLLVLANGRTLQWEHLQIPDGNRLRYISQIRNLTTDWTEQCVTFNSLDNDEVMLYAGMWGAKTGTLWWDDLRIESVPTLNILRRDSLPVTLADGRETTFEEGRDVETLVDPALGKSIWPGTYDTRHDAPPIRVPDTSRIQPGQTVYLSCYHPLLVYDGQVNCSLSEPKVFELCREQIAHTESALQPDGYFMSHDEIRCAGWEPDQIRRFKTSGELLAYNVKTCRQLIREVAGDKPVYVWSDMFDPHHNAHDGFYLVNNTLEGSWEGLDKDITIVKWGGGERAAPGLKFFADRGHTQIIAAYYDGNIQSDFQMWNGAMQGIDAVTGVMYTTWQNNYSRLADFAAAWWPAANGSHQ